MNGDPTMTDQMTAERTDRPSEEIEHPSRRQEVERLLDSHRIPWRFRPDIPVNEMKVDNTSQVRVTRTPEEALVEQYAVALRRGAIFPAVVIRKGGYIVDGNHRRAAAIIGHIGHLPGYLIEATDSTVLTVLAAELNQTNGARLSHDEQRALAELWSAQAMSSKDIAAGLNRTVTVIDRWAREREFRARCERIGMVRPSIAMNTQAALVAVHNDGAFAALVNLAEDAGLSYDALRPVINDVKACTGEAAEVMVVKRHRAQYADRIQMKSMGLVNRPGTGKTKIIEAPATAAWKNIKFLTKYSVEDLAAIPDGRNTTVMAEGWRTLAILADRVATKLGA